MSTITLADGTTTISLPGALDWTDRYAWSAVGQSMTRGLTGKPIIQAAALVAGRPITLQGDTDRAWVDRSVCDDIQAWADVPGKPLSITLYGHTYLVYMRHHDAPAFDARPIAGLANPPADWPHYITLKLITRTA